MCVHSNTLSSRLQLRLTALRLGQTPGLQNLEVVKLANMSDLGME